MSVDRISSAATSVAIVCPGMASGAAGGVESVAKWLHQGLSATREFQPTVVSVAVSARDSNSSRLLEPRTWRGKPTASTHEMHGLDVKHFGAAVAEFEVFRCLPRRALTEYLRQFDVIQVVSG